MVFFRATDSMHMHHSFSPFCFAAFQSSLSQKRKKEKKKTGLPCSCSIWTLKFLSVIMVLFCISLVGEHYGCGLRIAKGEQQAYWVVLGCNWRRHVADVEILVLDDRSVFASGGDIWYFSSLSMEAVVYFTLTSREENCVWVSSFLYSLHIQHFGVSLRKRL